jgi:hypothetical protein
MGGYQKKMERRKETSQRTRKKGKEKGTVTHVHHKLVSNPLIAGNDHQNEEEKKKAKKNYNACNAKPSLKMLKKVKKSKKEIKRRYTKKFVSHSMWCAPLAPCR